jgi:hypothetical protein
MSDIRSKSRTAGLLPRRITAFLVLITAALVAVVGCASQAGSKLASSSLPVVRQSSSHGLVGSPHPAAPASLPGPLPGIRRNTLDIADGEVPDDVTVFADDYPAVTKLDTALLQAIRTAAREAAGHGVKIYVNSGWRSKKYQTQLFEQAIAKYGSEASAARWVARPGSSIHEAGGAVDVGPDDAAAWLSRHGARYGLCEIYRNEPWHYELRPAAVGHGCPRRYTDPSHDPRMR